MARLRGLSETSDAATISAHLWFMVVHDQPFADCNKRTGAASAHNFMRLSGYETHATPGAVAAVGNAISGVRPDEEVELAKWIRQNYEASSR